MTYGANDNSETPCDAGNCVEWQIIQCEYGGVGVRLIVKERKVWSRGRNWKEKAEDILRRNLSRISRGVDSSIKPRKWYRRIIRRFIYDRKCVVLIVRFSRIGQLHKCNVLNKCRVIFSFRKDSDEKKKYAKSTVILFNDFRLRIFFIDCKPYVDNNEYRRRMFCMRETATNGPL